MTDLCYAYFYICFPKYLYSHRVVALSLCRYVGFPLEMKSYIFIRHIGTRTKQLHGWSLLNSLTLRAS